ncbi:hypothetical protein [Phenylobacterium sp.]|uniref:hypothetical protein n=1 Tax=Phenylobacterium sp. TaxID=1871053 RepID=UPI0035AFB4E8
MSRRTPLFWAAGVVLGFAAQPAAAAEPPVRSLQGLAACSGLGEAAARAACYDAAYAALVKAVDTGEVIIVERQEAQAVQRSAFGLNLPTLSIFDRGGAAAEPLDSVTGVIGQAQRDAFGRWTIVLVDGATWRQIDDEALSPAPRKGQPVEIRKAAFGSYFLKVDGQRGVRAKRSD